MPSRPSRVLMCGASVAGPTAAYWLSRQGVAVTVVERTPLHRVRGSGPRRRPVRAGDGGGRVDRGAAARDGGTRTEIVSLHRDGGRGVDVEMSRLVAGISGRQVEIMSSDLARILVDATQREVRYLFVDSIHTLVEETDGSRAGASPTHCAMPRTERPVRKAQLVLPRR